MKLYFILAPETVYERQKRVRAHRQTPFLRESLSGMKSLAPRLKELGVVAVASSDLDGQAASKLAKTIGVPQESWPCLRGFNWGAHHGAAKEKAASIGKHLVEQWKADDSIPVHRGDSAKSFEKRMASARERISRLAKPVVIMAGSREISMIVGAPLAVERGRIYEWNMDGDETPAIYRIPEDTRKKILYDGLPLSHHLMLHGE